MAKYGKTLAQVQVYINGKEQAKHDLEELTEQAEAYKKAIADTRKSIADNTKKQSDARDRANASQEGTVEHTRAVKDMLDAQKAIDEGNKSLKQQQSEYNQLKKVIRETEKFTKDLEADLENLSGQKIRRLKEMMREVDAIRNALDPNTDPDGTFLQVLNQAYNDILETIKNKKGELIEFKDIMDDLMNIDDTSLAKAEQRLRALISATDKDDVDRLKQLNEELGRTVGEKNRRIGVQGEAVLGGDYTHTIEGTKEAIELLKKYQSTLETTNTGKFNEIGETIKKMNADMEQAVREQAAKVMASPFTHSVEEIEEAIKVTEKLQAATSDPGHYNDYARQIAEARRAQQEFVEGAKFDAMSEQLKLLPGLSDKALQEQQKYWQAMIEGASKTDTALTTYRENLQKTMDEERRRLQDSLKATQSEQMLRGGDVKKSVGDIKELIKDYERLESLTDATDAKGLKEIRDVIANLRQQLKQTEQGFMSFDEALDKARTDLTNL